MSILDDMRMNRATARITDEAIHAEVLREIEAGIRRDGLWVKAIAESDGTEHNVKGRYIKLRVQAFKDELTLATSVAQHTGSQDRVLVEKPPKHIPEIKAAKFIYRCDLTSKRNWAWGVASILAGVATIFAGVATFNFFTVYSAGDSAGDLVGYGVMYAVFSLVAGAKAKDNYEKAKACREELSIWPKDRLRKSAD